jgi:hypothetical protein
MMCGSVRAENATTAPTPTTQGRAFVLEAGGQPFIPWGFNYDRDYKMRLIEEYWETEWPTVESDFKEMKKLGANVVRVHLQFAKFMKGPGKPNENSLNQLKKLTKLAEETGLYLDLTGLACYRLKDVPAWYDRMSEAQRWEQQVLFWGAVAEACKDSPAVLVYDLVNEPVIADKKVDHWVDPHDLSGFTYVQFIARDPKGRKREEVARQWVRKMTAAIGKHDPGRMITVGMLPATGTGFDPKVLAKELSYISVHIYPDAKKPNEAMDVLRQFNVGKPVVIEEIFPLAAGAEQVGEFIKQSRQRRLAAGWIGFYWGQTPAELRESKEIKDAFTLAWLESFEKLTAGMK